MWQALRAEISREFWQPEPWGVVVEAVRLARKEAVRKHAATREPSRADRREEKAAWYRRQVEAGKRGIPLAVAPHLPLTPAQKTSIVKMYGRGKRTWDIASVVGATDGVVREYLIARKLLRASDV